MADLIAELLILFESFKFWKKKKAIRKRETDKGLPRGILIHPTNVILILATIIVTVVAFIAFP